MMGGTSVRTVEASVDMGSPENGGNLQHCPFLDLHVGGSRCLVTGSPRKVSPDHQVRFCLTPGHPSCRRFRLGGVARAVTPRSQVVAEPQQVIAAQRQGLPRIYGDPAPIQDALARAGIFPEQHPARDVGASLQSEPPAPADLAQPAVAGDTVEIDIPDVAGIAPPTDPAATSAERLEPASNDVDVTPVEEPVHPDAASPAGAPNSSAAAIPAVQPSIQGSTEVAARESAETDDTAAVEAAAATAPSAGVPVRRPATTHRRSKRAVHVERERVATLRPAATTHRGSRSITTVARSATTAARARQHAPARSSRGPRRTTVRWASFAAFVVAALAIVVVVDAQWSSPARAPGFSPTATFAPSPTVSGRSGAVSSGIAPTAASTPTVAAAAKPTAAPSPTPQPTSTPTPTTTPAPSGSAEYTVVSGDTLSGIASRFGTNAAWIATANSLSSTETIAAGQRLFIPGPDGRLPDSSPWLAVHEVVAGDTLSGIGDSYGVSSASIASANALGNGSHIESGWVLLIPKPGNQAPNATPAPSPGTPATTYTVVKGDTLFSIAQRFGVTVDALMAANGLTDRTYVDVGWILVIPAS